MPRKLKFKKIIYPLISGVILILIIVVFIYSVRFLAEAIDRVFAQDAESWESRLIRLDMEKFNLVAKKLGIVLETPETELPTPALPLAEPMLDKTAAKIEILNSIKKAGLANELKIILENDGFIIEKIGNISPALATTTIKIKESKKDFISLVRESVSKKYPETEDKALEETENFDIIIIIGSK